MVGTVLVNKSITLKFNLTLLQTKLAQPLVDNDCIFNELINEKLLVIYKTWFPTLLEAFLTVQM